MEIKVPVSPEMEEVIFEHAFGGELGVYPDERAWILTQARKKVPGCVVLAADLDIENGEWVLSVTVPSIVTN